MASPQIQSPQQTVLIVESDVLVRHALAEYLRGCGFAVVETATALEAKTVMRRGPEVDVMLADARAVDGESGFALAQWTRRYRPRVAVVLTSTIENKSEAIAGLCGRHHPSPPSASFIRDRIQAMRSRPAGNGGGLPKSRARG
ncbi:MAG TPA: response regulator [Hyphomonadaceae bacterium]|jgi:CheY-like chemotaxis protein